MKIVKLERDSETPGQAQLWTGLNGQISTCNFLEKCSNGAILGSVMPAALAIVFSSICASASCNGHGSW
jgi:hypothetical protein